MKTNNFHSGTKLGQFWDRIGTVLVLTRDFPYVKITMLKTVTKRNTKRDGTLRRPFFMSCRVQERRSNRAPFFRFRTSDKGGRSFT